MRKYFGTDGIRRIANTELTPELVYKVAKAGAYVLSKHTDHAPTILIGRDTRISGTLIESAMVAGFLSYGANVKLLGVIPTPAVAYLTRKLNADASVVISASHNTFEFNGIKYFSNKGMKIPDSLEEEIEEIMESDKFTELTAKNENIGVSEYALDLMDEYVYFFRKNFDDVIDKYNDKDFVVALDTANGATSVVAEKVFQALGINYRIINNHPDGININANCGSTHLEGLKKYVVENHMSLGVAYDGDGDRCLAVDEKGNEIDGDKLLAIISQNLKRKGKLKKDTIVATVMSNLGLNKYARDNGLELLQTKVGDRYVLEEMLKDGYNLGGEQSGHVILLDYNPTGDGILTSLMLISTILEEGKKASELSEIVKLYPQVLVNAKVDSNKKYDYDKDKEIKDAIDKLEREFAGNGRVLIRPSGTEPLVRVMIEGEDQEYITKKAQDIADLIEKKLK
ncbi:MAG: phosphoglucosamine mutase [Clostridiales bacterium]|nr:phosphoglucosamine mutase [Clostridiales bacterium]MBD9159138.1 phosphoglucosamine mutase [Clostridiales bacterium]